jgi:hypothetical protein
MANRLVKSPSGICFFPHIWEVDTFNPQKAVYSVHIGLEEKQYHDYMNSIKTFLGSNHVEEEQDWVRIDRMKLYRKKPSHPKNTSNLYLVKSQMKSVLELPEGDKKQKPFVVNKQGEDIKRDTALEGCICSIHSKPTVYGKVSVISNILKGLVIFGFPKQEEVVSNSEVLNDTEHRAI